MENRAVSVGGRRNKGKMRFSILLVVLISLFSFPSFFYGDAEAQDESDNHVGLIVLVILTILGIGMYFLVLSKNPTSGGGKFTLIILIVWTFFWIVVGAQGTVTGIVVYMFVGLPSTLFGWFLWWLKHPEEKQMYLPFGRNTSKIVPARTPRDKSTAQSQSSKPPKAKKKKDPMRYLRCPNCENEDLVKNYNEQYCLQCGWKKE